MSSSLSTLADLLTRLQFLTGLVAGGLGSAGVLLLRRRHRPSWALVASLATMVGVHIAYGRRLGVVAGLALLALGGWLLDRTDRVGMALGWPLVTLGALTVSLRGGLGETPWIVVMTPLTILLLGAVMRQWQALPEAALFGVLVSITSFGIWATVPNTDVARVLLGASIPLAPATLHRGIRQLSGAGAFALAGLIVWTAATGGEMRHGSIVGAWGCVALLGLWPLVRRRVQFEDRRLMLVGHSVFVLLSSRVFGLWETGLSAALGVSALALTTLMWRPTHRVLSARG